MEALTIDALPNGDEIIGGVKVGCARNGEALENRVASLAFGEYQKRRNLDSTLATSVRQLEGLPKDLIAAAACLPIVKFVTGFPIVAVVNKHAILFIQGVRPIRLGQGAVKHN
ncbi:hypothetical protein AA103196_0833 [Ameyamaea chiangmaiensis NBRC 103196]|nr:hypothetical protein AA103196_0833 [Ameyamaea chiangmaiensis NBRC 103196]GLP89982.1 hypothetical protein GCM10007868_10570 [Gluconobacter frateurii]